MEEACGQGPGVELGNCSPTGSAARDACTTTGSIAVYDGCDNGTATIDGDCGGGNDPNCQDACYNGHNPETY